MHKPPQIGRFFCSFFSLVRAALREGIDAAEDPGVKAELETEYTKNAQRLKEQNAAYNKFCEENGLKRLSDRIQVAKWGRKEAREAVAAARKADNALANPPESGIIQHIRDEVIPNMKTDTIVPRQRAHRVGTKEYIDRQQKLLKEGQYGPSYITISDEEILKLVKQYKGTGRIRLRKMKWDNQEIISTNETVVGVVVNNKTGKAVETTVFKIHYGKKGVHIVPDYPSKKE